MSRAEIRQACSTDAEMVHQMNEAFNGEGTNSLENVRRALEKGGSEMIFLAETDGKAAGYCCVQVLHSACYPAPCAELTELYVAEEYRRQGIASDLVRCAEKACREQHGMREIHLLTGRNNASAQAFYRAMGFREKAEAYFSKRV